VQAFAQHFGLQQMADQAEDREQRAEGREHQAQTDPRISHQKKFLRGQSFRGFVSHRRARRPITPLAYNRSLVHASCRNDALLKRSAEKLRQDSS
jgi:hypothetical protein